MDAVMEFLAEGMREAPLAVGALIGFGIGGVAIAVASWRERRRDRERKAERDEWQKKFDAEQEAWRRDRDAWQRQFEPKRKTDDTEET